MTAGTTRSSTRLTTGDHGAASGPALELRDLSVSFRTATGPVQAVDSVSLSCAPGQVVGLVGESGCGKSTLARAAMGLLPGSATTTGQVLVQGRETSGLGAEEHRRLRGDVISMVVQDPATSLDPTAGIGAQVAETVRAHRAVGRREARRLAVAQLQAVGIPDAAARYGDAPHRFSGGMRQRVVIAAALVNDPAVLVADEPTTALDVTIQAQVLELVRALCVQRGTAVLLITHDLGVVSQVCDHVAVMYAGQVVERAPAAELFREPRHPYTRALLAALPSREVAAGELAVIPGQVPDLGDPPTGCRFASRCAHRAEVCATRPPDVRTGAAEVACWLHVPGAHPEGLPAAEPPVAPS